MAFSSDLRNRKIFARPFSGVFCPGVVVGRCSLAHMAGAHDRGGAGWQSLPIARAACPGLAYHGGAVLAVFSGGPCLHAVAVLAGGHCWRCYRSNKRGRPGGVYVLIAGGQYMARWLSFYGLACCLYSWPLRRAWRLFSWPVMFTYYRRRPGPYWPRSWRPAMLPAWRISSRLPARCFRLYGRRYFSGHMDKNAGPKQDRRRRYALSAVFFH